MTTFAAMLSALPLALGRGTGTELRQPLGLTIVGGLLVSQLLTLLATPVVYLYMDRLQSPVQGWRASSPAVAQPAADAHHLRLKEKLLPVSLPVAGHTPTLAVFGDTEDLADGRGFACSEG